ncbi:hypothetical protein D3C75_1112570 [compost metagenome]
MVATDLSSTVEIMIASDMDSVINIYTPDLPSVIRVRAKGYEDLLSEIFIRQRGVNDLNSFIRVGGVRNRNLIIIF